MKDTATMQKPVASYHIFILLALFTMLQSTYKECNSVILAFKAYFIFCMSNHNGYCANHTLATHNYMRRMQNYSVDAELSLMHLFNSDIFNSYFMISICRPHATPCGLWGGSVWQSYDDYQVTPETENMWKQ